VTWPRHLRNVGCHEATGRTSTSNFSHNIDAIVSSSETFDNEESTRLSCSQNAQSRDRPSDQPLPHLQLQAIRAPTAPSGSWQSDKSEITRNSPAFPQSCTAPGVLVALSSLPTFCRWALGVGQRDLQASAIAEHTSEWGRPGKVLFLRTIAQRTGIAMSTEAQRPTPPIPRGRPTDGAIDHLWLGFHRRRGMRCWGTGAIPLQASGKRFLLLGAGYLACACAGPAPRLLSSRDEFFLDQVVIVVRVFYLALPTTHIPQRFSKRRDESIATTDVSLARTCSSSSRFETFDLMHRF
jgi:hypothetical protein